MATIGSVDDIDPSAVRLFLAVVELGSVSKAAARMRVAQPSATAKLQKLERQLGVALLERTANGSIPTQAGSRLVPICTSALTAVTDLVDAAAALRSTGDTVVVATTRHVAEHFLPGWLGRIDVVVSVIEHDTLGVARAVRDGDATVGFVEGPDRPIGLQAVAVAEEPLLAVVGRVHEWFGRTVPVDADELAGSTMIVPRAGSGLRDVVLAAIARHTSTLPTDLAESPGVRTSLLAAINGRGLALLPSCTATPWIQSGALSVVPLALDQVSLPVRLVWRGDRPATMSSRRFVAAICTV